MLPAENSKERLVAAVLAGAIALNYPLLHIFSSGSLLFGIPVLYLYLFTVWAILIGVVAHITERAALKGQEEQGPESDSGN